MDLFTCKDIIEVEKDYLRKRREEQNLDKGSPEEENWFGIALSGGGIRSATINLGFLKTLNRFGILKKADYLSSVSGGGYTHAYVQTTLKAEGDFQKIFTQEHIDSMRMHGEYMIPGQGFYKNANTILLAVAFLVSWGMSLISPFLVLGLIYHLYIIVTGLVGKNPFEFLQVFSANSLNWYMMVFIGGILGMHFLVNIILNFNLGISKTFNRAESILVMVVILLYGWISLLGYQGGERLSNEQIVDYIISMVLLFLIGYFTNPNALSFHRYYRKQLADLFLRFSGEHKNILIKDLVKRDSTDPEDSIAPYPLINTCLNLLNPAGDAVFKGTKTSDYFLLSPIFCGSKLVGYVPTANYWDYQQMTLPAAITISAAAVNPGMGMYSNKVLSVLMTLFNARLGFWISNPRLVWRKWRPIWWPTYFFRELLGRIGSNNDKINISDGGHIENLGAYELLRRGCRLVIAIDAGEDRAYTFFDLNNFLIRARNEMGLEIRFRDDEQPEDIIRPKPTQVFSKKRFAIADICQWWADEVSIDPITGKETTQLVNYAEPKKVGTFIYVKSSVTAPKGKPHLSEKDRLKFGTYKYKIYHPDFPHESTSDQFFDEIQWESYYQLGQYIAADVLGIDDLEKYENEPAPEFSVAQLLHWFDDKKALFVPEQPVPKVAVAAPSVEGDSEFESFKTPVEATPATTEGKYSM